MTIAAAGAHQVGRELRGDGAVVVAGFIDQTEGMVADGLGRVAVAQGVVALGEGGGGLGLNLEPGLALGLNLELGGGVIRGGHERRWRRRWAGGGSALGVLGDVLAGGCSVMMLKA
ncbi:hypothetical protein [Thiorhodovibrio winogradskyi]|uniref:hypothetical protein n=1 Tax=Thiorhodovibrio winogradskyi TaxID=77007 RepID=UPI002E2E6C0D|nr:hypothetical protein [Thiorhodovibrio winogradskyi]